MHFWMLFYEHVLLDIDGCLMLSMSIKEQLNNYFNYYEELWWKI